ncbi:MAG: hypothetical protein R3C24_00410 [Cyanobacteriota/Melainabacteria group bacterium]
MDKFETRYRYGEVLLGGVGDEAGKGLRAKRLLKRSPMPPMVKKVRAALSWPSEPMYLLSRCSSSPSMETQISKKVNLSEEYRCPWQQETPNCFMRM